MILNPPTATNDNNDNEQSSSSSTTSASSSIASSSSTTRTYLHHIVTQNVDGLHHKTHLPRNKLSILHGCIFTEVCDTCSTEYVRSYEIQSIGLQYTGRQCTQSSCCGGKLKDTLLDWEDPLPQVEWNKAQLVCSKADLILCLGTSLRIEPAGSLCTFTGKNSNFSNDDDDDGDDDDDDYYDNNTSGNSSSQNSSSLSKTKTSECDKVELTLTKGCENKGKDKSSSKKSKKHSTASTRIQRKKLGYVIINLQPTPYDDGATLIIRAKVDDVMQNLMHKLGYTL